jgi:hypothetical protein
VPLLLKFLFSRFTTLTSTTLLFAKTTFICHQAPVSLAHGRSCNVASALRPCVCSYYSSSPPAPFRYTASSGCLRRVVHVGARECQQRCSCSRYILVCCTVRSRAMHGLYTQRSFLLARRHGGIACSPSPIRYVCVFAHPQGRVSRPPTGGL